MAIILDDFRKYLEFYMRDYLSSVSIDWSRPIWIEMMTTIDAKTREDFRFSYLKYFMWAYNEELLNYYYQNTAWSHVMRQSNKVLFIMDGEFLRFNDYETKTFIREMYELSGVDVSTLQSEPVEPYFEDLIHFIDNFIVWHKKNGRFR